MYAFVVAKKVAQLPITPSTAAPKTTKNLEVCDDIGDWALHTKVKMRSLEQRVRVPMI